MLDISLDTEGERWMWGGIIGGTSIAFVAVSLAIRRVCKRCARTKQTKKIVRSLCSEDDNGTVTHIEGCSGTETVKLAPSAPPYDEQL
jgi:hypothetical protein